MTITIDRSPTPTLDYEAVLSVAPEGFETRWRAPFMGEQWAVAKDWFEVQDLLARVGAPGWEYLVVEPDKPAASRSWAQCLGRTQAMTVEVAEWHPDIEREELWRLGLTGARMPWVKVDGQPGCHVMVRPCQVLTAHDAIIAFHDWLTQGQVPGFTRELVVY